MPNGSTGYPSSMVTYRVNEVAVKHARKLIDAGTYDDTTNSYRREDVWLVPAKDGAARRVVRGGFPRWSTNGQTLFVHSRMTSQILALNMADLDAPPTVLYDKTPG